jgi:hypothetical protein
VSLNGKVRQIGKKGSSNQKWGGIRTGTIAEVSITTDSEQDKITFLTYFCMLNRFKLKSGDKGFVLKEIQETKGRDTFQSTASKEMRISKKTERYDPGGGANNASGGRDFSEPRQNDHSYF